MHVYQYYVCTTTYGIATCFQMNKKSRTLLALCTPYHFNYGAEQLRFILSVIYQQLLPIIWSLCTFYLGSTTFWKEVFFKYIILKIPWLNKGKFNFPLLLVPNIKFANEVDVPQYRNEGFNLPYHGAHNLTIVAAATMECKELNVKFWSTPSLLNNLTDVKVLIICQHEIFFFYM